MYLHVLGTEFMLAQTLLQSERPKHYGVLAFLSAVELVQIA